MLPAAKALFDRSKDKKKETLPGPSSPSFFSAAAVLILSLMALLLMSGRSEAWSPPERRRPQFQTEPGYYLLPIPYSLPGIGSGFGAIGAATNILQTHTDVYGYAITGDLAGYGGAVTDIHLIPEKLILDLTGEQLSRAVLTNYSERGMGSNKDDFTLLDLEEVDFLGARLTSTFLERRFEIYGGGYTSGSRLKKITDRNENVILEADNSEEGRSQLFLMGARLDLTDDYADPRKGFRLDLSPSWSPPRRAGAPNYYKVDYNATAYFPIGKQSTWAFNYFRSDAQVIHKGETDRAVLERRQGLNCESVSDPDQQKSCLQVIDNMIAENSFGTATSLGGRSRLRSYPEDRFKGAHTVFYGTELRWSLTDERTPFNLYIMKDVRTAFQIALFYEIGSASDSASLFGESMRSSYGAGLRMVTASGVVFRADVATGHEGVETTVIIGFPWEFL